MRKKPVIRMNTSESSREAFARFILVKRAQGIKIKSVDSYEQHFRAIGKHLDTSKSVSEWTEADLGKMIHSMQESHLSPNSIRSYSTTMKVFLAWCNSEGMTNLTMAKYKGEDSVKETYTDEELERLLKRPNTQKCSFVEFRSWTIINLLVNCGCRAGTIRYIQNRDVDFSNSVIHARHTKNGKPLIVPLCSEMVSVLHEYMKVRGGNPDDFLFCNECGEQLTENALRCSIADYNRRHGVQTVTGKLQL